jgi:hypothetical protein
MITATKNVIVTTRKLHECDGCGRTFPKGTEMECISLSDNVARKFLTSYLCPTCIEIIPHDGREFYVGQYYNEAIDYEYKKEVKQFKEDNYKKG